MQIWLLNFTFTDMIVLQKLVSWWVVEDKNICFQIKKNSLLFLSKCCTYGMNEATSMDSANAPYL